MMLLLEEGGPCPSWQSPDLQQGQVSPPPPPPPCTENSPFLALFLLENVFSDFLKILKGRSLRLNTPVFPSGLPSPQPGLGWGRSRAPLLS